MPLVQPPLVLLAGMNCTDDLWADAGFTSGIRPVLDRADIDEQVAALRADLAESFVLVGHSLGAIVAMALALAAPERVAGLCLVSTNAKEPTDLQRDGWRSWLAQLDAGVPARELQQSILNPLLGAEVVDRRPDLVARTLQMGDDTGAELLRAQLEMQLTRTDLLGRLHELRMPVLIVSGLDDVICPPHFHTEIASEVAGARLVSLDAGHLLPLERPWEFGELVRAWCAQHRLVEPVGRRTS
ncbi:MAG: alpha/beta hydrolase [Candidatus Microbacterium colombiense]|nr:MAG: alpha/beta hydrolase [Microbacterium sp.]